MKRISIAFFLILVSNVTLWSHNQDRKPVHQRIVLEAYKLLKLQLSKEDIGFADMDNFIGEAKIYKEYYWHKVKTVTDGAEHEDYEDIVYGYKGIKNAHRSITHFWDADHPTGRMKLYFGQRFPSAYTKALRYVDDNYTKEIDFYPDSRGENYGWYSYKWDKQPQCPLYLM